MYVRRVPKTGVYKYRRELPEAVRQKLARVIISGHLKLRTGKQPIASVHSFNTIMSNLRLSA